MRVVFQSNCQVQTSFLLALLRDGGVQPWVLDGYVSSTEGSIGAFPRRIAVGDDDERQALRVLREAGEIV
jgi:hypothetical protein